MIDCVVIGAGPAGLAASVALVQRGVDHVVMEQGRVGSTWRTQRWDSFQLNTPGWANQLLFGEQQPRDHYAGAAEVVERLDSLAAGCPVRERVRVTRLTPTGGGHLLQNNTGDAVARCVVIATGDENLPRRPPLANAMPARIVQYHAAEYRSPQQLPDGAVLVVGSAQSGCQISEELLAAGRRVVLATSPVGRAPAWHRGRPSVEWLFAAGFFDQRPSDLPDPAMMRAHQPILAPRGLSLSLQLLARSGATLARRLVSVDGERVQFDQSAADNIAAGNAFAARARAMIDDMIRRTGADAPPAVPDDADLAVELNPPAELDLRTAGVTSVLWCTGFGSDFSWLYRGLVDECGRPRHVEAAALVPGLWYVGLRWLTRRGSGQLPGMTKDAADVADQVRRTLDADLRRPSVENDAIGSGMR